MKDNNAFKKLFFIFSFITANISINNYKQSRYNFKLKLERNQIIQSGSLHKYFNLIIFDS